MESIKLIPFVIAAFLFIITPGIDTVFVINKSLSQGSKEGAMGALGINFGIIIHTMLAALGLSLLIAKISIALTVIKFGGAAYLIYLGVKNLLSKKSDMTFESSQKGKGNSFVSGMITNTLNPKVLLFFLAFFPQFISQDKLDSPVPFLILGLIYAVMGTVWYLLLNWFAGLFSGWITKTPAFSGWLNRFSGLVFILMGVKIATND